MSVLSIVDTIIAAVIHYRYLILFPIAAVEGPIFSIVVGFLIRMGYLELLPAFAILMLGDVVPDAIYYLIGRYGNSKKLLFRYGKKLGLKPAHTELLEKLWQHHPKKTILLSKLAYGLSTPFLISAGLVKMPAGRFIRYAALVSLMQYSILVTLGYVLGGSYTLAVKYVKYGGVLIAVLLILFVAGFIFSVRAAKNQIVKLEKEEESRESPGTPPK